MIAAMADATIPRAKTAPLVPKIANVLENKLVSLVNAQILAAMGYVTFPKGRTAQLYLSH